MPTVPRLEPQVEQKAFGNASVSTSAPIEAFGGGQAASAYGGLNTLGAAVNSITSEMKQRADDAQTSKAYNALARKKMELQLKASQRRGEDAFGVAEEVADEFSKYSDEVYGGLANRTQQAMFEKIRERESLELSSSVEKHVFAESMKVEEETAIATSQTAMDDAILNPEKAPEKIELGQSAIHRLADSQGWSPEVRQKKLADYASKTHAGIVTSILARGDDLAAKAYYDANVDALQGGDKAKLDAAMKEGSTRGESRRQADRIIGMGLGYKESLAEARKIENTDVSDMTVARIQKYNSENEQAERQMEDDIYLEATNLMEMPGNRGMLPRDVIPPDKYNLLPLDKRNALAKRSSNPDYNNDKMWLSFIDLPPKKLAEMNRSEFELYWTEFDQAHKRLAETMWMNSKKPNSVDTTNAMSWEKQQDKAIRSAGLVRSTKEKSKFTKKEEAVYTQVLLESATALEAFELSKGKGKATIEERQKILDEVILKNHRIQISEDWAIDKTVPASQITDAQKPNAYIAMKHIPPIEVSSIEARMKKNGLTPSREAVERAYAAYLMGDKKRAMELVGEK